MKKKYLYGSLSAVTSYVYGDALISSIIDGTLTQYYHMDGMGSVRGLSDSSGGGFSHGTNELTSVHIWKRQSGKYV